jgi:hypothetical protein
MFRNILFLAAFSGICVSAPSLAQTPGDVRCLLLSNGFAKSSNNVEAQQAARLAASFFFGKVDGRWNGAQLRPIVAQQKKTIKAATAGPEMQRCIQQMQASIKRTQAVAP